MAEVITLVLVLTLVVIAVVDKYPADYYIAGFALFYYGMTQITTLSWLTLLFVVAGIYNFTKGAQEHKRRKVQ